MRAGSRTVAEIGERGLIERIRERLPKPPRFVVVGIGDDAAVLEPVRNQLEVITTDSQVEGVHFDRAFMTPADIGHKALAVNLSDLAAMGAAPRAAVLSLIVPPSWPVADLDAMIDGMTSLAARARVSIVGGNIARSPGPLIVDMTVTGFVHRRRVLKRSGGRPGDELYVTGALGGAAAALRERRVFRPEPRLRFGMLLGRNQAARACVDLSDGLADGVRQIADGSGVGVVLDEAAIPISPGASLDEALSGGEDYELLFAVSPKLRSRMRGVRQGDKEVAVTRIGLLTTDRSLVIQCGGRARPLPAGFAHFSGLPDRS